MSRTAYIAIAAVIAVLAAAGVLYEMRGGAVHDAGPPAALAPFALDKAPVPVPQVAFSDAKGVRKPLSAFKGKYVLLNLWATWCGPCVKELPALARLKSTLPADKVAVVAVDVGRGTPADARAFLDTHDAKALDAYLDTNIALIRAFNAFGLPLTILIDPQGREIGRAVGPAKWDAPEAIDWFKNLTVATGS
ncbi:MAG: TlpA family protein disulfide reductase [Proteobacteria bacterium]|nr:TlpA family protein disulfide reductase [Pseudomonadota bacterium]